MIKNIFEAINEIDEFDAELYRGVTKEEAEKWEKGIPVPTRNENLMPVDWEIVEYGIGDEARNMSDEEIENWVKSVCYWYDGSLGSIKNGVNLTTDFDNAKGYGKYVLGFNPSTVNTEIADFSEAHKFCRNAKDLKLVFIYNVAKESFTGMKN